VQFHFGAGKAEMRVTNLHLEDYFNFPNGLADGHEVDATVSFDVVWGGPVTRRVEVEHGTNGDRFAGAFVEDHATVSWSGSNELGFHFRSNPGNFSTSAPGRAFAELGLERNGIFAGDREDDDSDSLAQALGTRGPQEEESATDRFFAALPPGGTGLGLRPGSGEGPTLVSSRPEDGFAGDTAPRATAVPTERPPAADPATPGPALFIAVGRPGDDVLVR
jgi:hypothetical protein